MDSFNFHLMVYTYLVDIASYPIYMSIRFYVLFLFITSNSFNILTLHVGSYFASFNDSFSKSIVGALTSITEYNKSLFFNNPCRCLFILVVCYLDQFDINTIIYLISSINSLFINVSMFGDNDDA